MISSLVLKNKIRGLLNKQLFLRLPLIFFEKVSFFLQNLSGFHYNRPRSTFSMHRIQKFKKRRHGRQKWNLKKYWKNRGIGLKLDVIKEEAVKEYLAEIENDDDSLEWDQCGKPNHILSHKNSGTYFGLIKFPANFSPSELALQRLCHGRTLQQTFPTTISASTMTEAICGKSSEETSKTTLFPTEETNANLPLDSKRVDGQTFDKSREKKKFASSKSAIDQNGVEQNNREFGFRKNGRFETKTSRFKRKSQINHKKTKFNQKNSFVDDLDKTIFFPDQEISIKKSLFESSSVESSIRKNQPILNLNFEDASPKSNLKIENYHSSEPDQEKSCGNLSSSPQSSSINFDINQNEVKTSSKEQLQLKRINVENIGESGSGFFENSFGSVENILGADNFLIKENVGGDFAKIELDEISQLAGIFDLNEVTTTQMLSSSLENVEKFGANVGSSNFYQGPGKSTPCGNFSTINKDLNVEDFDLKIDQLETNVCGVLTLKNENSSAKNGAVMEFADQLLGEEDVLMGNKKNEPPPPRRTPTPNQPQNHPLRYRNETDSYTKSISVPPAQAGPGTLANYSVSMSGALRRMFSCSCADVEGEVAGARAQLMSAAGSEWWGTRRRRRRRNIVQLDHKSLWTDFVSDMIVNSRVRMSDG